MEKRSKRMGRDGCENEVAREEGGGVNPSVGRNDYSCKKKKKKCLAIGVTRLFSSSRYNR